MDIRWNGITNGYRAFVDYDLETQIEVIFTGNLHCGAPDLIRSAIPRMLKGEPVEIPQRLSIQAVSLSPASFKKLEGAYETRNGTPFDLRMEDGDIMAGNRLLIPLGESKFYCIQDYCEVVIVFGEDGSIQSLDWVNEGGNFSCHRVGDLKNAP